MNRKWNDPDDGANRAYFRADDGFEAWWTTTRRAGHRRNYEATLLRPNGTIAAQVYTTRRFEAKEQALAWHHEHSPSYAEQHLPPWLTTRINGRPRTALVIDEEPDLI